MGLESKQAVTAIAVSDMTRAREFYEGKLGLSPSEERPDGGVRYPCGGGSLVHVYPSPANAGSSTATQVGFEVDDIEATVDDLTANGVSFEQYDTDPIRTDAKGIAQIGEASGAWFKDPDGNILAVIEE